MQRAPGGTPLAVLGIQTHQEHAQDTQFEHRAGTAGEDPDDQTQDDRDEVVDAPDHGWAAEALVDDLSIPGSASSRRTIQS